MSRSSGTGYPAWFACTGERKGRNGTSAGAAGRHRVVLTGRTKPNPSRRIGGSGGRYTDTLREYRCATCGHVGWSAHVDLTLLEGRRPSAASPDTPETRP